jgi:nucleoside phosphorylase/DNA-binding NarL/FixJ family response regulator
MTKLKILIVEDKQHKVKLLGSVIKNPEIDAKGAPNIEAAQIELMTVKYDIVLIDIQIPNDMISDINPRGGIDLLEWIEMHPLCKKPKRIFGVTSHSEAQKEFSQYFINKGLYLLKSQIDNDNWLQAIDNTCQYLLSDEVTNDNYHFDIAIITAMSHNELQAILALPINWTEFSLPNDPSIYYKSEIETSGGIKSIVVSHSPRMGLSAAAALSSKLIMKFSPSHIIMAGIAAGIENKAYFGDILVAEHCWDWGNGKLTADKGETLFQPAPHQEPLSLKIKTKIQKIRDNKLYVDQIQNGWKGKETGKALRLKLGPIASGAVVLEDPGTLASIIKQNRETIGVEMEGYAVMTSARISTDNSTIPIVIKSVCDFANPEKNNDWQEYACYTSAQFTFHFITNDLFSE